ncbi:hypothetical protein ACROYT_G003895 [Oculina patagonica]
MNEHISCYTRNRIYQLPNAYVIEREREREIFFKQGPLDRLLKSAYMKVYIYLRLLTIGASLYLVSRITLGNAAEQCKTQGSFFKKALKRHTFDKFKVNRPDACIKRCQNKPNCRSLNYVMEDNICELNNRSKETSPDDYVTDQKRIYMTVPFNRVPIGSVPEVPAVSCLEIKAIEGEEAVSGDYWLDRNRTGKAIQIYCHIGKGTLFYWTLSGTDNMLNLRGTAKFVRKSGRKVLYLDGTQGTFAETSAIPFQQTDLTIAVWIKLVSPLSSSQEIYADWSSPHQFRLGLHPDGRLHFQGRRNVAAISDVISVSTGSNNIVDTDVWRHVAMTWGRADRKVRLYINGEVKAEIVISDNPVLDFKNSGHSVYDIGLKRDSATTTHAYFSDLTIFTHELSETELKNELFLDHALSNFI